MRTSIAFWKRHAAPYLFIAPTLCILLIFSLFPIVLSFCMSFTDMSLKSLAFYTNIHFVGLENYMQLFQDELFYQALFNTIFYAAIGVPLVIACSLAVAILLNYGTNVLFTSCRLLYYAPSITNIVAVTAIWGYLYNSHYGLLNQLLGALHLPALSWLYSPYLSKISLIIMAVWKGIGLNMLIFLAALKSIPKSCYEAASIDGASPWQQFRYITFPMMRFAIFFVTVTTLIGWIQFFEEPLVMTKGGPLDSTLSIALLVYQYGFSDSRFGYAAAGSCILFLIIIVVSLIQFKLRRNDIGMEF